MSLHTKILKLFKWDLNNPEDLELDFDIEKSLNDNWDKIDKKVEELEESVKIKVDKEEGLGLSQENFTTTLKNRLLELKNYDDSALKQILDGSIKDVTLDPSNGHIIFHKNDETTCFVDTALELIIENGTYDKKTKKIVLTLANKNVIEIPIGDLITDLYTKSEIDEILNSYEKKHTYHTVVVKEVIPELTEYEIPFSYIVGNDEFEIFYNNEYLIREKTEEDIANYREVGEKGSTSNKVMFGWEISVGQVLVFVKKGAVENEQN